MVDNKPFYLFQTLGVKGLELMGSLLKGRLS